MTHSVVVLDACVLYPAPLRDLWMHLHLNDVIQAKWTHEIHEEWMHNVLKNRPDLKRSQLERTRKLMDEHAMDSLVKGYQKHIKKIQLPDEHDHHVLAAAIHCKATHIITFNLKDFPVKQLNLYGIKAQHPDDFLAELLQNQSSKVMQAIQQHRTSLRNPPKTKVEYLNILSKQGLTKFIQHVK